MHKEGMKERGVERTFIVAISENEIITFCKCLFYFCRCLLKIYFNYLLQLFVYKLKMCFPISYSGWIEGIFMEHL